MARYAEQAAAGPVDDRRLDAVLLPQGPLQRLALPRRQWHRRHRAVPGGVVWDERLEKLRRDTGRVPGSQLLDALPGIAGQFMGLMSERLDAIRLQEIDRRRHGQPSAGVARAEPVEFVSPT